MKNYSVFEILGPVMIGPSSSHTAGAARLGKVAWQIAGGGFNTVEFYLHGSFAKTYRGHGTDRALTAGILGMDADDERLRDSLRIAEDKGLQIKFVETDLGDVHPNTVKILFKMINGDAVEVTGSSVGGGNIVITEIDGEKVEFTGEYPTIVIKHNDIKGMINKITAILASQNINIATMKVNRKGRGDEASMVIETDNQIASDVSHQLSEIDGVIKVKVIQPI
jgi:L-serine dehydratase